MPGPSPLRRITRRGRLSARQVARAGAALRATQRTAMRIPADRMPPPPSAFARFGEGSIVVPPARITGASGIEIGDGVLVLEDAGLAVAAETGARLAIEDGARLAPGVEITCTLSIRIGPGVSTSDYAAVSDSWALLTHPRGSTPPPGAPVVIGAGAYLGWGSFVGPGVTVGDGAFVGEGAVVLDDVAPHSVVFGNPARTVRRLDRRTGRWEGSHLP